VATIGDTSFQDMLPSSIRYDSQFAAAAKALDSMGAHIQDLTTRTLIIARIDEITDNALLDNLAWQFHVDYYEGWALAQTVEQKRELIKNSIANHWHKGTRYSLERVFEILDMRGLITEWWEAPDDPDFYPYEFDITVYVNRPTGGTFGDDLDRLIDSLKNLRSHRRRTSWVLSQRDKRPRIGTAPCHGELSRVHSFMLRNMTFHATLPRTGGIMQTAEIITAYIDAREL